MPISKRPIKLVFDKNFINSPKTPDEINAYRSHPLDKRNLNFFELWNETFSVLFQIKMEEQANQFSEEDHLEVGRGYCWCFPQKNSYPTLEDVLYLAGDTQFIPEEENNAVVLVRSSSTVTAYFVESKERILARGGPLLTTQIELSEQEQAYLAEKTGKLSAEGDPLCKQLITRVREKANHTAGSLSIEKFKRSLTSFNYTNDSVLQDKILKLILQSRIALGHEVERIVTLLLDNYSDLELPNLVKDVTLALEPMEEVNQGVCLTIHSKHRHQGESTCFAETVMKVLIKFDHQITLEELSTTIFPTKKTYQIAQKIYNDYVAKFPDKVSLSQQQAREKDFQEQEQACAREKKVETYIALLSNWDVRAIFVLIFVLLSFTGTFSPIAGLFAWGGFNLGFSTVTLTFIDAVLGILTWAGTVSLVEGAWEGIKKIQDYSFASASVETLLVQYLPRVISSGQNHGPTVFVGSTVPILQTQLDSLQTQDSDTDSDKESSGELPQTKVGIIDSGRSPSSLTQNREPSSEEIGLGKSSDTASNSHSGESDEEKERHFKKPGSGSSDEEDLETELVVLAEVGEGAVVNMNPIVYENILSSNKGKILANNAGTNTNNVEATFV